MPIYKIPNAKKGGKEKYRIWVSYTDDAGVHKQKTKVVYGKEEAKHAELTLLNDIKTKEKQLSKITVRELFVEHMEQAKLDLRESTIEKSKQVAEKHILPYFADTRLDRLSIKSLQNWKKDIDSKSYSLSFKQNVYKQFSKLLNYAVKIGYIPTNPLHKVGNFRDTGLVHKEMSFYTADEFLRFISPAKELANSGNLQDNDFYVFFCCLFYLGLRKGELHALRWTDIDGSFINIRRSINQKLKGNDRETAPKNKSSIRRIEIPKPLIEILEVHKALYKSCTSDFSDSFHVCGGISPLRDTSVDKRNRAYSERAGLKHIRIHDFRHSHASLLANSGVSIQEIARRLGHSKVEITWNTYSHLYPHQESLATSVLNTVIV